MQVKTQTSQSQTLCIDVVDNDLEVKDGQNLSPLIVDFEVQLNNVIPFKSVFCNISMFVFTSDRNLLVVVEQTHYKGSAHSLFQFWIFLAPFISSPLAGGPDLNLHITCSYLSLLIRIVFYSFIFNCLLFD